MIEPVDPDQLEEVEFPAARRGVDPAAVRSTLAEAADSLRLLTRRCHELEHRLEELEAQVPAPDDLEREREAARAEGRAAGELEGAREREAAQAGAESLLAEAKEEGRQVVVEAQTLRRRMLEDLAKRRRVLRQQVEQLRGGRERLLEAYEVVGHTMREATAELTAALPEARAAAERAGHGVGPEETVEQLEAEIESARLAGLPIVAEPEDAAEPEPAPPADRRRPVTFPLERDVRDMRQVEPVVADFEEVRVISDDDDESPTDESEVASSGAPAEASPTTDGEADAGVEPDPPEADEGGGEGGGEDAAELPEADSQASSEPTGPVSDDDVFARLRRAAAETSADDVARLEAVERDDADEADAADGADDAHADAAGPAGPEPEVGGDGDDESATPDAVVSPDLDDFDHPDDAAEPFGLALGAEPPGLSVDAVEAERRATSEHELARRLKRLLSDEQNDVLDRLRRSRKRSVEVTDLLDDLDERVMRFAEAVEPVLAEAALTSAGDEAETVDDLAAELAREVAEALVDGLLEPLEEGVPVGELAGPVRGLYRRWKTDRIGVMAERYVEAACEAPPTI